MSKKKNNQAKAQKRTSKAQAKKQTTLQQRAKKANISFLGGQKSTTRAIAKTIARAKASAKKRKQAKASAKNPTLQQTKEQTQTYLKSIEQTQKSEQSRFESIAQQQQKAFEQQFAAQGAQLNQRLSDIQRQSAAETQGYQSLIARITGQQEQEMGRLRQQFDRQNQESESVISRLQSDIERLSTPLAAPKIDVDTRPAVVGISGFQEASQRRQRLGTSGGRRSSKAAPTGAFGLQTAY